MKIMEKYNGIIAYLSGTKIFRIYHEGQILVEFKSVMAGIEYCNYINKHGTTDIFSKSN